MTRTEIAALLETLKAGGVADVPLDLTPEQAELLLEHRHRSQPVTRAFFEDGSQFFVRG